MVTKGRLEFANFICRFGEDRVLLDFVEEIIIPAFVSVELERLTATSKYFFHDVQIVQLGTRSNPIIGIAGRFIKDMTLSREQVFDPRNRRLISDRREIQSAPSSVFLLILNNHKLLFLRETQQAPGLVSFETTIKYFIQQKHNEFVEALYQANQEASVSRRSLLEQYPRPTIEIVALASGATLEEFIGKFNILENIKIKLLATNNEIDNNEFFELFRESGNELGSKKTTLEYQNKEGLSKGKALAKLEAAAKQGNSRISFSGTDSEGEPLQGSNDKFKVFMHLSNIPRNISQLSQQMFAAFQKQVERGVVYNGDPSEDVTENIERLQNYLTTRDEEQ